MTKHDRYMKAMKKLHGQTGKHTCKKNGCSKMVLGSFCLDHIESEISRQWQELETGEILPQLPKEEK